MPTVLIVEDHEDFVTFLGEILQLDGWIVLTSGTVDDAWATARNVQIDVVVSDVLLPGGEGVDLKAKFLADPKLSAVPFVFMTGYRPHIAELAPEYVVLKPFSMESLGETLAKVLSRPLS